MVWMVYFLQFKSEFGNKEFMIWATVSSWSCFCWLYRASPSLDAKNIINLDFGVGHLVMSMCRVFSCVAGRGCLLWPVHFLGTTLISLCPASFRNPRPNLPVTPGVSWLPTFAFQSPIMKKTSFLGVSSKRSCRSSQRGSLIRIQTSDVTAFEQKGYHNYGAFPRSKGSDSPTWGPILGRQVPLASDFENQWG